LEFFAMFFWFWNLQFLEYAEVYCFDREMDVATGATFDKLAAYTIMSHCNGMFLNEGPAAGVMNTILDQTGGTWVNTYFESNDRMQLAVFKGNPLVPGAMNTAFIGANFPACPYIISARATVFMDMLLFRRNMQMELVSAEEHCPGCLAHKGYIQNFASLAPYFGVHGTATGGIPYDERLAVVGASAGGVMAVLGAVQLSLNLYKVRLVQTTGMPRPGNKALSKYIGGHTGFETIASVYYRDPMPHIPMTILGYRQAAKYYVWLYRTAGGDAGHSQVRTNGYRENADSPMDAYIANKIWFFRLMDHTMYFATADLTSQSRSVDDALNACGQYSDALLVEYHTSDLFNF